MGEIDSLSDLLAEAGEIAMGYFRRVQPEWKLSRSLVTEADRRVQEYLTRRLRAHFPSDGIIAEEDDLRVPPTAGTRYWVIDPIDGTASFVAGLPVWGIGIALVEDGRAVEGYFHVPMTGDTWSAPPGGSVRLNGEEVLIKPPAPLYAESVILAFSRMHRVYRLSRSYRGKVRSLGSTIGHMCFVAAGSADVAILDRVWIWDVAPGLAMLTRNGGILRYLHGAEVSLTQLMDGGRALQGMICGHPDTVARVEVLLAAQ